MMVCTYVHMCNTRISFSFVFIVEMNLKLGQISLTFRTNTFGKVHVLVVGGLGAAVYSI